MVHPDDLPLTPRELRLLMRHDFVAFAQRCFLHLNPGTNYLPNWHIEAVAHVLDLCRRGQRLRQNICMPPRSLKSHLVSIAWPAFLLGHNPSLQIICASYSQEFAEKLSRDCRNIMSSDWYRKMFPWTVLSKDKQAANEFVTTAGGGRLATSVDGVLTGRGADFIIIDDALKADEALSDARRTQVNNWLKNTLISRLNDKARGAILIVMQRLHLDDLVGQVMEQGGWDLLSLPAIATQDEEHLLSSVNGVETYRRRAGEALHPERESPETLEKLRIALGEYVFTAQFQQEPVPFGGGMVKEAWLRRYADAELPKTFDLTVHSWDPASSEGQFSSYSVCSIWGVKDKKIYLRHVYRKRVLFPELRRAALELANRFPANAILIEEKSSGAALLQQLPQDGLRNLKAVKPHADKKSRMYGQTAIIENGFVFLPRDAPWLRDYVSELTSFPEARHDDQVDSTSQALEWISTASQQPGYIDFLELMAKRIARGDQDPLAEEKKYILEVYNNARRRIVEMQNS